MAKAKAKAKSKSRSRAKSSSAAAIEATPTRKSAKRAKTSSRSAKTQMPARAFVGFDSGGRITALVLDETSAFGETQNFRAVPVKSLLVEETETGARLIVMDLSSQSLLPAQTWMPPNKFDLEKIRIEAVELTKQTADKASDIGHRVAEAASEISKKVSDSAIGQKAVETATELGKKAADKASDIGHRVAEAASEFSKKVSDSAIGQKAAETATELGKKTAEAASRLTHRSINTGVRSQQATEQLSQRNYEAVTKDAGIKAEHKQAGKHASEKPIRE